MYKKTPKVQYREMYANTEIKYSTVQYFQCSKIRSRFRVRFTSHERAAAPARLRERVRDGHGLLAGAPLVPLADRAARPQVERGGGLARVAHAGERVWREQLARGLHALLTHLRMRRQRTRDRKTRRWLLAAVRRKREAKSSRVESSRKTDYLLGSEVQHTRDDAALLLRQCHRLGARMLLQVLAVLVQLRATRSPRLQCNAMHCSAMQCSTIARTALYCTVTRTDTYSTSKRASVSEPKCCIHRVPERALHRYTRTYV